MVARQSSENNVVIILITMLLASCSSIEKKEPVAFTENKSVVMVEFLIAQDSRLHGDSRVLIENSTASEGCRLFVVQVGKPQVICPGVYTIKHVVIHQFPALLYIEDLEKVKFKVEAGDVVYLGSYQVTFRRKKNNTIKLGDYDFVRVERLSQMRKALRAVYPTLVSRIFTRIPYALASDAI